MNSILQLKKSNCKDCYKCIRECPVKSIKFSDHQANIIKDECILCGMCFVACPQNAKEVRQDFQKVKAEIVKGKKVIATVAPSFIADFPVDGIEVFSDMLKKLGFFDTYETAEGAYLVKTEYENMIKENNNKVIISSCCHSINTLIQKYYPDALPYLAKTKSPMEVSAQLIKKEHPDSVIVFIGPCISKKAEVEEYGILDYALTFEEIRDWFENENITPDENIIVDTTKKRSRFFPMAGGILKSMEKDDNFSYYAVDGVKNCMDIIEEVANGNLNNCFLELNSCIGGCIGGPATSKFRENKIAYAKSVEEYAKNTDNDFNTITDIELKKEITYNGVKFQKPGSETITKILAQMGKTKTEHELNCGTCGYNTCRDKAIAIYRGKADPSMCLPFIKARAQSFSDKIIGATPNGIIVLDENLFIQQINKSALSLINLTDDKELINTPVVSILNPQNYVNALSTPNVVIEKKNYLAEYNKYVYEYIIYDEEYKIIIIIMRDITYRETLHELKQERNAKTLEITDKVIEKQMRVVQEIASLLGETTAETKVALTKLKETLENE